MNHPAPARDTRLLWFILVGCVMALMLIWTGRAVNAGLPSAPAPVGLAVPPASNLGSQYVPGLMCTLSLTNTADFTNQGLGITFTNASSFPALASYSTLVLSIGNVPDSSSPQQYPAFDEYFRLDNAIVGAIYKVDVIPGYTNNYNLGIIVYDVNFRVLLVDLNPQDGNTASVSLTPNTIGPYYFRIVQLTPDCTGLSYQLRVTYTPSTGTPTSIASPTVTGDVQDSFEPNETITNATPLNANSYTGLTLYHSSYSHPGDDQDWYSIFVGSSQLGFKYTISFVSDGNLPVMDLDIYNPSKTLVTQAVWF